MTKKFTGLKKNGKKTKKFSGVKIFGIVYTLCMEKLINRPIYMGKILKTINKDYVKILTGVRRSGKSYMLKLIKQHLLEKGIKPAQIIYINFEDLSFKSLSKSEELINYVDSNLYAEGKTYLFIDEVQEVENWAQVINSFNVSKNIDIYITGSNSNMFIGQHLTYLSGRYISFEILPLSIKEVKLFLGTNNPLDSYYPAYKKGSFPMIVLEDDDSTKGFRIDDLYNSVYLRDIMQNGKIWNSKQLENVARFLFESVGKTISIKKIHDTMTSFNETISINTVSNHIKLFEAAYLLYNCKRYDISGKKLLSTNGKFYSVDIALSNKVADNYTINDGYQLENFVFLELKKAGFTIYTISVGKGYEIDFLAKKNDLVYYIQVSISILDEKTRDREARPFKYIKGNGEKFILTLDTFQFTFDNCKHMNIFKFIEENL